MMRAFSRHKSTNGNALCELLLIVQEQHGKRSPHVANTYI